MTQVTFNLPTDLVERAREAGLLNEDRLIAMIEAELEAEDDVEDDWEDTPDEEIEAGFLAGWDDVMKGKTIPADVALAGFREGWHDAMTGNTRPWREVFDELENREKNGRP